MKILLVKTSSLGDVIHMLPAITEAADKLFLKFDWVVEKSFSEVPKWHPQVENIIPVELRKWRKNPFSKDTRRSWKAFKEQLLEEDYDIVIDAQGLMKSAFLARQAEAHKIFGPDYKSAWEPLASLFYNHTVSVDPTLHAVTRMRHLLAEVFEYQPQATWLNYGIDTEKLKTTHVPSAKDYICLCHGTTWKTKEWPESYWYDLGNLILSEGLGVVIPFGNAEEEARAKRIADKCPGAEVLPKMSLTSIAGILSGAKGVIAVDTGLGHLSAALGVPCVSLYGPTDPKATGAVGENQKHLAGKIACAPCLKENCSIKTSSGIWPACFESLSPQNVFAELGGLIR